MVIKPPNCYYNDARSQKMDICLPLSMAVSSLDYNIHHGHLLWSSHLHAFSTMDAVITLVIYLLFCCLLFVLCFCYFTCAFSWCMCPYWTISCNERKSELVLIKKRIVQCMSVPPCGVWESSIYTTLSLYKQRYCLCDSNSYRPKCKGWINLAIIQSLPQQILILRNQTFLNWLLVSQVSPCLFWQYS